MRQVLDVNILDAGAVQKRVMRASIPAFVAAALVFGFGLGERCDAGGLGGALAWAAAVLLAYAVCLPAHELVHGAFFKLLGPAGTKVRYGYKSGMLFAGCPGALLARGRFVAVLMAPCLALSLLCLVLGFVMWDMPAQRLAALCVFLLHLSGCTGDFYFVRLIALHREADLVEDTDRGIRLWSSAG